MGEEDEGAAAGARGELLPVAAAAAQGDGRVPHRVQLPGGHPCPRRRLAHVVAVVGRPDRVHERPDRGTPHQGNSIMHDDF